MENPYQSPRSVAAEPATACGGWARQISVVAVLLMVQGGLQIILGGFFLLFGGSMAFYASQEAVGASWAFSGISSAMGVTGLVVGAVQAAAGWWNYSFRKRWLGITGLLAGLASIFTCYCFPTSLVLMIYGLIVYCSGQSASAFSLGRPGQSRDQILWQLQAEDS